MTRPPPAATPPELLRVLADPERLAVAGSLVGGSRTAAALAEELSLPVARVRRHLGRLTAVGLVVREPDRTSYRYEPETLRRAAREVGPPREPGIALGAMDDDEETVLRHYFVGGRLREIPARHSKRLVVLSRLAVEFEAGVRYPEREVNRLLGRFHDDFVSLRRFLVDEGFLSRDRGEYWRSGGPVDV